MLHLTDSVGENQVDFVLFCFEELPSVLVNLICSQDEIDVCGDGRTRVPNK